MSDDPTHFDDPRFTDAVEAVLGSYADRGGINHIEGFNLPSRTRVKAILQDIEDVFFPGYYERDTLQRLNVRYVIGERLSRVHSALMQETMKALLHRDRCGKSEETAPNDVLQDQAREVATRFLEAIPQMRAQLLEDASAAMEGDPAAHSLVEVVMTYPSIRAIAAYRAAHFLHGEGVPLIPRMMTEVLHGRTGIDIHPGARIAPGLFIDHGTGVVIGETTVIGKKVKIYQGVTLGALSVTRDESGSWASGQRHPTIEDGVTIYAGATILGGETIIGEGSIIGGTVWLTRSVPAQPQVLIDPPYLVYESTVDGTIRRDLVDVDSA